MISIKLEDISLTKKNLSFEIPESIVTEAYQEALKKIGSQAKLKGFRPGKVPANILEKYYDSDIRMEALNGVLKKSYPKALDDHKLTPIRDPRFHVEPLEKGKNYSYRAELEVRPVFELQNYLGLPVKKIEVTLEESEVDNRLKALQESHAELTPSEEGTVLADGMVATIDFDSTIDGKPFEGGAAKEYALELGKGHFLPTFEKNLIGLKKGDKTTFEVVFPEDYHQENLRNQKAQFTVTIQDLHNKVLPKLDDDFAKDLTKESLEALKNDIRVDLTKRKEKEFRNTYAKEVLDTLVAQYSFEVPSSLLEHQKEQNEKAPADEVEKSVRIRFVLEDIAKKESIKVSPQDLENRFKELSRALRQPASAVKAFYREDQNRLNQLVSQVGLEKTLEFLIDKANFQ